MAEASPQKRQQVRQVKSQPLVHQFFLWCDAETERVLDQSPIATGIGYARNQW